MDHPPGREQPKEPVFLVAFAAASSPLEVAKSQHLVCQIQSFFFFYMKCLTVKII